MMGSFAPKLCFSVSAAWSAQQLLGYPRIRSVDTAIIMTTTVIIIIMVMMLIFISTQTMYVACILCTHVCCMSVCA